MKNLIKAPASTSNRPRISVCVITYKRPVQLRRLLESLVQQVFQDPVSYEVIVVDNDVEKSAKPVVTEFLERQPGLSLVYDVEPEQGIPMARNRSVSQASGEYVAFIDDDERADQYWLDALWKCIHTFEADAILGPVVPEIPESAPGWIKKGCFFDRPQHSDGSRVQLGRTGNALIRIHWLRRYECPFDPRLSLTGGSDSDFFRRIREAGAKFCWAEHAVVHEAIGNERLRLKWLLMRAFRGGQGYAWRNAVNKGLAFKIFHCLYRTATACFALILSVFSLPFGLNRSVWWLRKVFSNVGQLSAYLPYRYEEYHTKNYR